MKKKLILLLVALLSLSFSSCGAVSPTQATSAPVAVVSAEPVSTPTNQGTTMAKQPSSGAEASASASTSDVICASANGYTVEVLSAQKGKDYLGNDILLVKYRFTNNNSASAAFWQATNQRVTQNGRALSPDGIVCDDPDFMNAYAQISNGQSVICAYPYPYYGTDDLTVNVSIYNYATGTTITSATGTVLIK